MTEKDFIRCELMVLAWQRGNREQAASDLVELFERPVLYYVRRLVRTEDDAWDALQETFVAVLKSLPNLRDGRALPAFVYRTARNAALAQHRRRPYEPLVEELSQVVEDWVKSPPASICALNFGTTEPLEASTLPKRTAISRIAPLPFALPCRSASSA